VDRVDLEVFDVAYHIIGGGEEGAKTVVRTKEEADHSLPYLAAVALLDGEVTPGQYRPERIRSQDVQDLLRRVHVRPSPELSRRFPGEMACRVRVTLRDGRSFIREKSDYQGFHTRPMDFHAASAKFERLSGPFTGPALGREIVQAVARLESIPVAKLTALLQRVSPSPAGGP
jgi:2-methylcitrate dehydratase